jgi:uncharacterized protein
MSEEETGMNIQDMETLVGRIVERFAPHRIILFGSYASGTPGPDSDLDLLVVAPHPPAWREGHEVRADLQRNFSVPLQIVFMDAEEFEETRDVVGGLAYPAWHKGRVLYEKNP